MIEWPIYRNFSVFSQNSGYFDQNEKGVKKCPFPHSLRFCHNWWASGGVPGVRYAEKLSALFYLHWESLWPGVRCGRQLTAAKRVVGGTEAGFGSFPWMALVRAGQARCGGALIGDRWVSK